MMIYFILFVSVVLNGVLVWYCKQLADKFVESTSSLGDVKVVFSEYIEELTMLLNQYAELLKNIYELEEFYGDETIGKLIKDTKNLERYIKEYTKKAKLDEGQSSDQSDEAKENV